MQFNFKFPKIFYGWWIVAAVFFIAVYEAGVSLYGFTAFVEPIARETSWSYAQISIAASLLGAEMGLFAPIAGILVDRWGPRRLVFFGGTVSALGFVMLSHTSSLGTFYAAYFVIALGISFSLWNVLLAPVVNWFHRKVGLASGIAMSGAGLSGLLVPVIVRLIDSYGWRTTAWILGAGLAIVLLPLSLVLRHKPETYGYQPDGNTSEQSKSVKTPDAEPSVVKEITIRQILKNQIFWHVALAFTFFALLQSTILTHIMPYLSSIGLNRTTAGTIASIFPVMSIAGRMGLGWLGDIMEKRVVGALTFAFIGIGVFCLALSSNFGHWLLIFFIPLFGIGYGGGQVLRASMIRQYFGRRNFGTVVGLVMGINTLGGFIGPPLAGWVFDTWGIYTGVWFGLFGFTFISVLSIVTMPGIDQHSAKVDAT